MPRGHAGPCPCLAGLESSDWVAGLGSGLAFFVKSIRPLDGLPRGDDRNALEASHRQVAALVDRGKAWQLYMDLEDVRPRVWRPLLVPLTADLSSLRVALLWGTGRSRPSRACRAQEVDRL